MDVASEEFQEFERALNAIVLATRVVENFEAAEFPYFIELIESEAGRAAELASRIWPDRDSSADDLAT